MGPRGLDQRPGRGDSRRAEHRHYFKQSWRAATTPYPADRGEAATERSEPVSNAKDVQGPQLWPGQSAMELEGVYRDQASISRQVPRTRSAAAAAEDDRFRSDDRVRAAPRWLG